MNESAGEPRVVCAGTHVTAACSLAMNVFLAKQEFKSCQFLMRDWLDEYQFRRAALLWIVDNSAQWDAVHFALCNSIPLLVSDEDVLAKELCVHASCGLCYGNAAEAAVCLEFFSSNEAIRNHMGANGRAYVVRQKL